MLPLRIRGQGGALSTFFAFCLELAFVVAYFTLVEWAVTGFKGLRPRACSMYSADFWRHERYWKLPETGYMHLFNGTPFKSVFWRLLGVKIGRRLFDDGCAIIERTLVAVGDEATLNAGSTLHSHSMEDGTFKSDHVVIGRRCTIGTAAFVHYGAVMEDDSWLAADSFLMKGEQVTARTVWGGNPAAELTSPEKE